LTEPPHKKFGKDFAKEKKEKLVLGGGEKTKKKARCPERTGWNQEGGGVWLAVEK